MQLVFISTVIYGIRVQRQSKSFNNREQKLLTTNLGNINIKMSETIAKEFERFFSDENLKTEAFLMRQIQKNPGGWVDLKTILNRNKFNCIRKFANDVKTVADAIEASPNEFVQISIDHKKVRRNPIYPLPTLLKKFHWKSSEGKPKENKNAMRMLLQKIKGVLLVKIKVLFRSAVA